jgi:hypothetical protein
MKPSRQTPSDSGGSDNAARYRLGRVLAAINAGVWGAASPANLLILPLSTGA